MSRKTTTNAKPGLPVLVECVPYNARLTHSSCVDRWRQAQAVQVDGKGMGQGARAIKNGILRGVLSECRGCAVGERRAGEV